MKKREVIYIEDKNVIAYYSRFEPAKWEIIKITKDGMWCRAITSEKLENEIRIPNGDIRFFHSLTYNFKKI